MKLTLRKANALQLLVTEQINATVLATAVSVGRYDKPAELVQYALGKFQQALDKKQSLLRVLYAIRKKAARESQAAGIPDILTEIAQSDKMSGLLKPLAELTQFAPDEETLVSAHNDLKLEVGSSAAYSRRDAFTTGIIPQAWATAYAGEVSSLRKYKQNLSDKLLELNVRHEIELSESEVETLKEYDLI